MPSVMTVDPREFEALEEDTGAFDIRVDGVPVWERIRFEVYQSILEQNGVGQAHSTIEGDPWDYLKGFTNWLKNWVHRNPFLADTADVMFVGHQRRKLQEDGLWWDIYCDPIHEACDFDSVHFEYPYLLEHRRPAKTKGIRYLDLIELGGMLQKKLRLQQVSLPAEKRESLGEIERALNDRFDANLNITEMVIQALELRRATYWQYERLLNRVSPKVVILVISYGREILIEACHNSNIPTVELQHGVIDPTHFAYHFPGERSKEMFPEYLFTWGDYWSDCVEYPIDDDHVISIGYPFLEQERKKYDNIERRNQIIFLSQGTIGSELSKIAVSLADDLEACDVVFKIHPGEYGRWNENYPWLEESNVRVVDTDSPPMYNLMAESVAQVGVGSTALYEGLVFDLETFVVDLPGSEAMNYLVESGYATVVSDETELKNELAKEQNHEEHNLNAIFTQDPLETFRTELNRIL